MIGRVVLVGLVAMAEVAPARAETVAEAATRWGLLGVWKADCTKGASRDDVAFRYAVRNGKLFQDRDSGEGKDSTPVSSLVFVNDRTIEITIPYAVAGGARTLVLRRENGSQLLIWSVRQIGTDEYLIKDGQFTDGNPARPVLTHCSHY